MLTTKSKELSLLAQKIAAFKGCVICGGKPTLYQVEMKGFCKNHKKEHDPLPPMRTYAPQAKQAMPDAS